MALHSQPRCAKITGGIHRKIHGRERGKIHKLETVNGKFEKILMWRKIIGRPRNWELGIGDWECTEHEREMEENEQRMRDETAETQGLGER